MTVSNGNYGMRSYVGIAFQNSFGNPNITSLHFIPFLNENVVADNAPFVSENMRGIFDEGDDYEGLNTIAGDLEVEAQPISLGAMLQAVLGSPSTVNSGGIYTHTFKPRTDDFDQYAANIPLTYYKWLDAGSALVYYDLVGTGLELGIANGELLKCKLSLIGGVATIGSNIAASYPTGRRWPWDVTSAQIGGAAVADFKNLTVAIAENIEAEHTLNGVKTPSHLKRSGFRTVSINGTMKFKNHSEYDAWKNQTERSFVAYFKGATEIQSGYYDALKIEAPALRWREVKPAIGGPGPIEVDVSGMAKYLATSATAIEITLVNTQAAY